MINAGGLINCANEIEGYNREVALMKAEHSVYDNLIEVYKLSYKDGINTHEAAMKIANERIVELSEPKNSMDFINKEIMSKRENI